MHEVLKIDLNETRWSVSFPCPGCGEAISPEDKLGRHFDLLEVKIEEQIIEEAIIRCTTCRVVIHLVGFDLLARIGCFDES